MRIWAAITAHLTMTKPISAMSSELDLGLESHISKTSDDYYTPPYIFESLGLEFDMDVASPVGGISWIPTKRYLTISDDGLATEWAGLVWMNPPYSAPKEWINKFVAHGNGLCLVPTSKAKWLKFIWENSDGAMIVEPNLKFVRGNGYAQIQFQTIMFSMGEVATAALKASGLGRVR